MTPAVTAPPTTAWATTTITTLRGTNTPTPATMSTTTVTPLTKTDTTTRRHSIIPQCIRPTPTSCKFTARARLLQSFDLFAVIWITVNMGNRHLFSPAPSRPTSPAPRPPELFAVRKAADSGDESELTDIQAVLRGHTDREPR